jgi:hypothetical protein
LDRISNVENPVVSCYKGDQMPQVRPSRKQPVVAWGQDTEEGLQRECQGQESGAGISLGAASTG